MSAVWPLAIAALPAHRLAVFFARPSYAYHQSSFYHSQICVDTPFSPPSSLFLHPLRVARRQVAGLAGVWGGVVLFDLSYILYCLMSYKSDLHISMLYYLLFIIITYVFITIYYLSLYIYISIIIITYVYIHIYVYIYIYM